MSIISLEGNQYAYEGNEYAK